MNRPSPVTYLFGNNVSFIGLSLALIVSGLAAFGGAAPPVLPLVLLAIGGYAHSAHQKVRKYNAWKSQWEEMDGGAPKPALRPSDRLIGSFRRNPALRYVVGLLCLVMLGFMAKAAGPGPLALYLLAVIVLTVSAIVRSRRRRVQATTAASVSLCVPVPRQSVSAAQAYAALPGYCVSLFERSGS